MTNHSETTGSSENSDIVGREGQSGQGGSPGRHGQTGPEGRTGPDGQAGWERQHERDVHTGRGGSAPSEGPPGEGEHAVYVSHTMYGGSTEHRARPADHQVTLRSPAELADALPYLLGYRPEDSIVLVALHDREGRGRFGGRARLGIPANPGDWEAAAQQLAQGLVKGSERRGTRPATMVAYLCQEPAKGETGRQVRERLEPLARFLRIACGRLDIPVIEALCISDGRFWSYCCGGKGCCPVEGVTMGLPGTSVLAAAATYAGIQVRGTLRELRARLLPLETGAALEQEVALDIAGTVLVPRLLDEASRPVVAEETLDLARRVMRRLGEAPAVSGVLMADHRDDELLGFDEAAALVLGLQDRVTRDRAAQWMEGDEAAPALRLWRALARRCVGPYGEHAAAPLTLAGWVAWSSGDELEAREALAMALGADPDYLFARLLHQACNEGLDPESVRRCLRVERERHEQLAAVDRSGSAQAVESRKKSEGIEGPRTPSGVQIPAQPRGTRTDEDGEAPARPRGPGVTAAGDNRPDGASDCPRVTVDAKDPVGSVPHSTTTCARGPVPTQALTGRRRRRFRSAGPVAHPMPTAEGAEEDREQERRARGANDLRPRPSGPHPVRPASPGRGASRTRPLRKASTRRSGEQPERARSEADDVATKDDAGPPAMEE
ncbi:DUF4192 domain-containing protein [Streptomyces asoensis]|uniref:DUF4192 domain-containing protein n=1 Tax=Streptomyces asoensis TaxID=249586 RepID=UPI003F5409B2